MTFSQILKALLIFLLCLTHYVWSSVSSYLFNLGALGEVEKTLAIALWYPWCQRAGFMVDADD